MTYSSFRWAAKSCAPARLIGAHGKVAREKSPAASVSTLLGGQEGPLVQRVLIQTRRRHDHAGWISIKRPPTERLASGCDSSLRLSDEEPLAHGLLAI